MREMMVMDMLEMEDIAEARLQGVTLSYTMLGPNVDRKQYKKVMGDYASTLEEIIDLREYNLYGKKQKREHDLRVFKGMVKAFQKMYDDGTIDAFKKAVEKRHKELGIE